MTTQMHATANPELAELLEPPAWPDHIPPAGETYSPRLSQTPAAGDLTPDVDGRPQLPASEPPTEPDAGPGAWPAAPAMASTAGRRRQSAASIAASLTLAVLLAAAIFPVVAAGAYQALTGSAWSLIRLVIGVAAAAVIVAARARQTVHEPDVHDRQLDVVLAIPFLAAATWLTLAWPERPTAGHSLDARAVIGLTLFIVGGCLLLLGTRLTARIRWALIMPLLAIPALTSLVWLWWMLWALFAAGALRAVAERVRGRPGGAPSGTVVRRAPVLRPVATVSLAVLAVVICGAALILTSGSHWAVIAGALQ